MHIHQANIKLMKLISTSWNSIARFYF